MSHITLVRPPALISRHSGTGSLTPPIGLAYLASSLIEAGHLVTTIDALGEAPFQRTSLFDNEIVATGLLKDEIVERVPPHTDLIGVSCMFSQDWPYIRQLIESLKERFPQVPILTGGEHITALPEFTLENCSAVEYCVLGEGEETLVEVVDRLANLSTMKEVNGLVLRQDGKILRTPPRGRIKAIDDIPLPAWHLLPLETYLNNNLSSGINRGRSMSMIATRGCPHRCTFCSNPTMWTTKWIPRQPELVLDEIELYLKKYNVTNVDFYDLTAIVQKKWVVKFCQLIKERNLHFTWQLPSGTRTEAIDKEVCQLLYETGCYNLTFAPETGSSKTLKEIKKGVRIDRMLNSMKAAIESGLITKFNIVIGFPNETRYDVWQTIWFLVKIAWSGVYDVSISVFTPYPGSELFQELREENKIPEISDDYFLSLHSLVDPTRTVSWCKKISTEELHLLRILAHLIFFGTQYILRPWRFVHLLSNLISKHEDSRLDKCLQDYVRRNFPKMYPEKVQEDTAF
ncbi:MULTISPECIES: radical SAM protein [Spirulina sp. CCY15215]|uniref:B12-binding domain-containing radical SAM protein n=1 Tax=Spirulina sp. CCY15215 TaxID=2767591 RepID=UPI00195086C0|nr:radical SAM protein [Spirulina major]